MLWLKYDYGMLMMMGWLLYDMIIVWLLYDHLIPKKSQIRKIDHRFEKKRSMIGHK